MKRAVSSILLIVLLSGCGDDGGGGGDSGSSSSDAVTEIAREGVSSDANLLIGTWLSPCSESEIYKYTIDKNTLKSHRQIYSDKECTNQISFRDTVNSYTANSDGEIDFTLISRDVTIIDKTILDLIKKEFPQVKWELNKATDILGLEAGYYSKKGDKGYDIFKIEDGRLYFGVFYEDYTGSTPELRPTDYDGAGLKRVE